MKYQLKKTKTTLSGKEKFSDENLKTIVKKVIGDHPKQVEQYLAEKKVFALGWPGNEGVCRKAGP